MGSEPQFSLSSHIQPSSLGFPRPPGEEGRARTMSFGSGQEDRLLGTFSEGAELQPPQFLLRGPGPVLRSKFGTQTLSL